MRLLFVARCVGLSLGACAALVGWIGPAVAQNEGSGFTPYVGLPGKDVIWLPADLEMVEMMLDLAQVTRDDVVVDLGSGDGRTVIAAAKRGARGVGVELNGDLVGVSRRYAARAGVAARTVFVQQNLFEYDLSGASVITLFLLDGINLELRPKLLGLKPGTRVVSNTFRMGDWAPDATARDLTKPDCNFNCEAYLWIIPADVRGVWATPDGTLELALTHQYVTGALTTEGITTAVSGRVRGDEVRIRAAAVEYVGRVTGSAIEGTRFEGGRPRPWRADRR